MPNPRQRGFTLIEVMVTLLIVGIVATTLTLSLNAVSGRDFKRELERLEISLDTASDRAQVRGVPIAVEFLPGAYRFSTFAANGEWRPVEDDPVLAEHPIPAELRWSALELEGQKQEAPWRLVFSTLPPRFRLTLATPDGELVFQGTPTGAIRRQTDRTP